MNVLSFRNLLIVLSTAFALNANGQKLKFLVPDEAILQYAGSIGYLSAGAGYEVFTNKKGRVDLHYGFVPEGKGGALHIATVKLSYRPWLLKMGDKLNFYPFNPGIFISYTFHKNLSFNFDSEKYPVDYYPWSEALRPHIAVSSEVSLNTEKIFGTKAIRKLGLYIEANSNDYYLINYLQNTSALSLSDAFQLGIGLRIAY